MELEYTKKGCEVLAVVNAESQDGGLRTRRDDVPDKPMKQGWLRG